MLSLADRPELLTPREMGEADRFAISAGTSGLALMERAGFAVARAAARIARTRARISVLCGPGGNGGDGFVAARYLRNWGYPVAVHLLGERARMRDDAAEMAARWAGDIGAGEDFAPGDFVIDALYGAGLSRDVDGLAGECVGRINAFAAHGGGVLAVDAPSGLDGETGAVRGVAVSATATVTFFRLKPGHLLSSGGGRPGRLSLADIGVPEGALAAIAPRAFANQPRVWRNAWPSLGPHAHKYARGAALILCGDAHRTGAARLSAKAALRVGAGLVTLASPRDAVAVNASHETAVMIAPFDDASGFCDLLADSRRNAILIGPGAGVGVDTRAHVTSALAGASEKPRAVVLDADALTSFAGEASVLGGLIAAQGRATVITPHEGEFAKLFQGRADVLGAEGKLARARGAARALGAVVVLKGSDTVVAAPDERATIGCDLPATLATAGSGDTLAGLVCGLLAQGMPAFEAASAAVWLHGACARALGPGLIAEDLADALPRALASGDLPPHA